MRAKLSGIYSGDLPEGPPVLPANPERCWIVVQADIGPAGGDGVDTFTFYVTTPLFLEGLMDQQSYQSGKHLLIVQAFSWEIVEGAITSICASVHGESWEEMATALAQYGGWEFDSYEDPSNVDTQ